MAMVQEACKASEAKKLVTQPTWREGIKKPWRPHCHGNEEKGVTWEIGVEVTMIQDARVDGCLARHCNKVPSLTRRQVASTEFSVSLGGSARRSGLAGSGPGNPRSKTGQISAYLYRDLVTASSSKRRSQGRPWTTWSGSCHRLGEQGTNRPWGQGTKGHMNDGNQGNREPAQSISKGDSVAWQRMDQGSKATIGQETNGMS